MVVGRAFCSSWRHCRPVAWSHHRHGLHTFTRITQITAASFRYQGIFNKASCTILNITSDAEYLDAAQASLEKLASHLPADEWLVSCIFRERYRNPFFWGVFFLVSEDLNRASKCVFEFLSGSTSEHLNAGFGRRLRIQPAWTPGGKIFFFCWMMLN